MKETVKLFLTITQKEQCGQKEQLFIAGMQTKCGGVLTSLLATYKMCTSGGLILSSTIMPYCLLSCYYCKKSNISETLIYKSNTFLPLHR